MSGERRYLVVRRGAVSEAHPSIAEAVAAADPDELLSPDERDRLGLEVEAEGSALVLPGVELVDAGLR